MPSSRRSPGLIEVPNPDVEGREQIFQIHTRSMNIADDVDFSELAEGIEDASGADVKAICTEAGMFAIRDDRTEVRMADFHDAWTKIQQDEEEDEDVSKTFA